MLHGHIVGMRVWLLRLEKMAEVHLSLRRLQNRFQIPLIKSVTRFSIYADKQEKNIFMYIGTNKTNPYLERAVLTGITRISKESIFSDLNNLEVVTTTSDKYADVFGFTEKEVFAVMDEMGMQAQKQKVKEWYDGFNFGQKKDIYNPWSIIHFLGKRKFAAYWANSSSNSLISKLIREGSVDMKEDFEMLLQGKNIKSEIDEEIIYSQLDDEEAIWSLLLASGYLKVLDICGQEYVLALTNHEVSLMFARMAKGWFKKGHSDYNAFIIALLLGDHHFTTFQKKRYKPVFFIV